MSEAGAVVLVDFPGVAGPKRRPAVVVSSQSYHQNRPDIIVGLLTGKPPHSFAPSDVALEDWAAAGLIKPTFFRTFLATLQKSDVIEQIGRLSERDAKNVFDCVRSALAIS